MVQTYIEPAGTSSGGVHLDGLLHLILDFG
jgi:hypothetical protein